MGTSRLRYGTRHALIRRLRLASQGVSPRRWGTAGVLREHVDRRSSGKSVCGGLRAWSDRRDFAQPPPQGSPGSKHQSSSIRLKPRVAKRHSCCIHGFILTWPMDLGHPHSSLNKVLKLNTGNTSRRPPFRSRGLRTQQRLRRTSIRNCRQIALVRPARRTRSLSAGPSLGHAIVSITDAGKSWGAR